MTAADVPSGPILITGAAGFLGSQLAVALSGLGGQVHALCRPHSDLSRLEPILHQIRVHRVDLRARELVARTITALAPSAIFHCAKHPGAPAGMEYGAAFETNVGGLLGVLDALTADMALVVLGSSLEYGGGSRPFLESDAPAPNTVHGITKAAATTLCQQVAQSRQLRVTILRLFTVYGPGEPSTRLVPTLLNAAQTGTPVALTECGLVHDWIHVGDVVRACVAAAARTTTPGAIFNIGTGQQTTNEAVADAVERVTGRRLNRTSVLHPSAPHDARCWVANVNKARDVLGWHAALDLHEGLARTWATMHARPRLLR